MAGILKPNSDLLQGNEEGRYIIHGYNLYDPAENLFNGSMSTRVTSGYIGTSTRKTEPWAYWYGARNYLDIEFLDNVHIWDAGHSNLSNAKEIDIYNGKDGIKGEKVGTLEEYTLTYNEATPNWQKVASLKKGRYLIGYTASLYRVSREWYLEKQKVNKVLLLSDNKTYSLKPTETNHTTNMTSNTAPAPFVASASSIYSSTYPAWKAFNGTTVDTNDCWMSKQTKSGYLIIDFGESKKINNFKITPRNDTTYYLTSSPKEFSLLGSQDGVIYEELGVFKDVADWEINKAKDFTLNGVFNFRFYKLNIIDNNGAVSTAIGELLFSYAETVTQIPSDSVDNFIKYGASSIENFNLINTNKNYILSTTDSVNTDGLLQTQINRKPLSIKF